MVTLSRIRTFQSSGSAGVVDVESVIRQVFPRDETRASGQGTGQNAGSGEGSGQACQQCSSTETSGSDDSMPDTFVN